MAYNFDAAEVDFITSEKKLTFREIAIKHHIPVGSILDKAGPKKGNWTVLREQYHKKLVKKVSGAVLMEQKRRRLYNIKVTEDVINLFGKTLELRGTKEVKCPKCGMVIKLEIGDFSVNDFEKMARLQEYLSNSELNIKKSARLVLTKPIEEYTDTELSSLLDKGEVIEAEVEDD